MNKPFTHFLAMLLVFAMTLSIIPMAFAAPDAHTEEIPEKVYDQLDPLWDSVAKAERSAMQQDHVNSLDKVTDLSVIAQAVTESEYYVADSLQWQGPGRFTFQTTVGIPCAYSVNLREKARTAKPAEETESTPDTLVTDYRTNASDSSKGVYVIGPYYGLDSSFTDQYGNEADSVAKALGTTYTLYKKDDATIDNIAKAVASGAVVFFDSHGDTDYANPYDEDDFVSGATTSYLCLQSGTGLTTKDYEGNHAYYGGAGYYGMKYYEVDGTVIANHLPNDASDCMVWMAICLGMATDGLEAPLRNHGVDVVYGYSQSVTFYGDYLYEAAFWGKMKSGATVAEAIKYMKAQYGDWDCGMDCSTIAQARKNYAAFPIVVSDEDIYPGHGKVDDLQTVKSTYSLFGNYTVTARASDASMGTVSAEGFTVTATPNEGYYVSGYSLDPVSAATVTQDGNVFQLSGVNADCTLTVEFSAKTPFALHFSVPDGVTQSDISTYVGDSVTLPKPTGTPTAEGHDYQFVGWLEAPLSDTTDRPTFHAAGSSYTVGSVDTLYALYCYGIDSEGGESNSFEKVTASRDFWQGEYVITGGTQVLLADGTITGTKIGSSAAAVDMTTAGITVNGDELLNVASGYVFVVSAVPDTEYYTIRMKDSNNYLACTQSSNSLDTVTDASSKYAQWKLSFTSNAVEVRSAAFDARTLRYNNTNKMFRCYTSGQKFLTLYATGARTYHYLTDLNSEAHVHNYTAVVTEPTCTERGYTTYTCVCGKSYVDNYVSPLDHNWDDGVVAKQASCTEAGEKLFTCARCHSTKTEEIPAVGHDLIVDAAVPATCTEAGLTEGSHCTRCDYKVAQERVPAMGHDLIVDIAIPATCTEAGLSGGSHCSRCDYTTGEEIIPALGHKYELGVCTVCNEKDPDYSASQSFSDVPENAWYTKAVTFAVQNGLFKGTGDGSTFSPSMTMSRAMLVTVLWRHEGEPKAEAEAAFSDVSQSAWFAKAVAWASENDIVNGSGGKFMPNDAVSREQIAVILFRYGKAESKNADLSVYPDGDLVSAWAKEAMRWAVAEKLISGNAKGELMPKGEASRAEVATILMRYLQK